MADPDPLENLRTTWRSVGGKGEGVPGHAAGPQPGTGLDPHPRGWVPFFLPKAPPGGLPCGRCGDYDPTIKVAMMMDMDTTAFMATIISTAAPAGAIMP